MFQLNYLSERLYMYHIQQLHLLSVLQVQPVEEHVQPELHEEISHLTSETSQQEDIIVEMAAPDVKHKEESRVEHVLEVTKQASLEAEIDILAPEETEEEEIKVDLSALEDKTRETTHVSMVEDYLSPDEEEEIYHLAPEPAIEGADVPGETATAEKKHREEMLTMTLEEQQSVEDTETAQTEFSEEKTQEEEIIVDLDAAEKEAAKPSLVATSEEQVDVQETKQDVAELEEEKSAVKDVPSQTTEGGKVEPPPTRVEPVGEQVLPEGVTSELISNIKEVYMIPTYVQPEWEPAVVEKYRLEARIRGQELTEEQVKIQLEMEARMRAEHEMMMQKQMQMQKATTEVAKETLAQQQVIKMKVEATSEGEAKVELNMAKEKTTAEMDMAAAEMATQIVRAVREVTEEQQEVTEVVREEVEVIQKAEIQKEISKTFKTEITQELMAPVFEIPLSDVTALDGERTMLKCHLTGVPKPEVTWYVDNEIIKESQDIKIMYEEGICTLEIVDVIPEDEGEYKVKAVNDAGTCETTAFLTVLRELRFSFLVERPQWPSGCLVCKILFGFHFFGQRFKSSWQKVLVDCLRTVLTIRFSQFFSQ